MEVNGEEGSKEVVVAGSFQIPSSAKTLPKSTSSRGSQRDFHQVIFPPTSRREHRHAGYVKAVNCSYVFMPYDFVYHSV